MEMVKQDNRRQLCARSISDLFLKIIIKLYLMRFEQDQKETEDACRFAEQNVAAQRYFVEVLQVLIMFKHLNSRICYLCILLCLQVEV
ncbi:hypothetical protein ES319_D11G100400v1 [Gossypium barbadense]|uniref:Uncharacterized protein n=2 Tax=Gossypium TaxID=3633 RepID=A0A5J5PD86_GOSBA|nr:hypothetical protein ES319_D11G100400v1 [Gossypium barbadense]TYG44559.1 hypothetical protein ES288_D11G105700v1 [Gossypium darwinii]